MIGEIRDPETATIASERRHRPHGFSALHTNDALGAFMRLMEMGVEPFLVASALTAVLGHGSSASSARTVRAVQAPPRGARAAARITPGSRRLSGKAWCLYRKGRVPALQPHRLPAAGSASSSCSLMNEELAESSRRRGASRDEIEREVHGRRACARSGTTASPRSRRGSRPSKTRPRRDALVAQGWIRVAADPNRGRSLRGRLGRRQVRNPFWIPDHRRQEPAARRPSASSRCRGRVPPGPASGERNPGRLEGAPTCPRRRICRGRVPPAASATKMRLPGRRPYVC